MDGIDHWRKTESHLQLGQPPTPAGPTITHKEPSYMGSKWGSTHWLLNLSFFLVSVGSSTLVLFLVAPVSVDVFNFSSWTIILLNSDVKKSRKSGIIPIFTKLFFFFIFRMRSFPCLDHWFSRFLNWKCEHYLKLGPARRAGFFCFLLFWFV